MASFAVMLAACSGGDGGVVTFTDDERLSKFDLPESWHVYELAELSELDDIPFDEQVQGFSFPAISSVGFDGGPVRDVGNLESSLTDAEYPIGSMSVRQVGEVEKDLLSRAMLTQSVLPYYGLSNSEEITKEDFSFGNGFDGVRVLVAYQDETATGQGVAYLISVSNEDDTRIYSMIAGCNRECFIANQDTIEGVVDSWLVNKRA
ncbi:MAG TPA: hypothetical protein VFP67_13090 [Acidimicrobiia bacterium]|jgi:hypothetical protein|nr:hypothetical protein [Acidimicrobiia bacterium]